MRSFLAVSLGTCLAASATACADELGLYVGAGAAQSTVRQDYYQINAHELGWKVLAGWRPIGFLSGELEYVDFGGKSVTYDTPPPPETDHTKTHATAAYAVLYPPVPIPYLDVYGKVGVARVTQKTDTSCATYCGPSGTTNNNGLAWGLGAQFKFGMPAVRIEWENFHGQQGNAALISAALTLNF
jgi:opacity protein-like surface antigen